MKLGAWIDQTQVFLIPTLALVTAGGQWGIVFHFLNVAVSLETRKPAP